jgi:hypothetical protein
MSDIQVGEIFVREARRKPVADGSKLIVYAENREEGKLNQEKQEWDGVYDMVMSNLHRFFGR